MTHHNHDHSHDHDHANDQLIMNMQQALDLRTHLQMMQVVDGAMRLALLKLLPNVGDSVTVDLTDNLQMVDDETGERVTRMSFYRDDTNAIDIRPEQA